MNENIFSPLTIHSKKRYYLIDIKKNINNEIVLIEMISEILKKNVEVVFGEKGYNLLEIEIENMGQDKFIIICNSNYSSILRVSMMINPNHRLVHSIFVLHESSFLQSLIHKSNLYFQYLE